MKQNSLQKNAVNLNEIQKEELIRQYVPLIRKVISRLSHEVCASQDKLELFEYGVMGLVKALDNYKFDDRISFSEYAENHIREYIMHLLKKEKNPESPQGKKNIELVNFNQLEEPLDEYGNSNDQEVEPPSGRVNEVLNFGGEDPLTHLLNDENSRLISIALNRLSQLQKECIRLTFYENMSLGEIAERFGLSEEQVSNLRNDGLRKLRQHLLMHH